ncbi:MAG: hypothetical protein ACLTFJ_07020, partial [Clostridium sp.]
LLIASVIFHLSDGLYLSAINDNIQNLFLLLFASTTRPFLIRIILAPPVLSVSMFPIPDRLLFSFQRERFPSSLPDV